MDEKSNIFRDSVREFKSPRTLAFCGMMAALGVVLGLVATIEIGPYIRIGFSELPNRVIDAFFGPVIGAIFGGALDIIKFIVKPTGTFFFGFTFDAMLSGAIFGILQYKKPISWKRILIANFLIKLIVNCGFNTLWLTILYGKSFWALIGARALKNAIMLPIDTVIQFFCLTFVNGLMHRTNMLSIKA